MNKDEYAKYVKSVTLTTSLPTNIIMAFLVFNAIKVLKIAVEVGLVVGITAAISPIGSAIFFVPNDLFSSIIPQVFVSL